MSMFLNMMLAFFFIGIFCILFYAPSIFAKGILCMQYGELSLKEKVICKIPVFNVSYAEHLYTGGTPWTLISNILLIIAVVLRIIVYYVLPTNYACYISTTILIYLAVVATYVANFRIVFLVISDSNTKSMLSTIAYSVLPTLGQYYIGTFLDKILKNTTKLEETFK